MVNLGNSLNKIVYVGRLKILELGELTQLSFHAYDITAKHYQEKKEEDEFPLPIPIGYSPNKTTMIQNKIYKKEILLEQYNRLAFDHLSINGLIHLVTIIESIINDVVRIIILKYPKKLGKKIKILMSDVLQASTMEEIYDNSVDKLINENSYKSPLEFADFFEQISSINLKECPPFHKYVEAKATRDIHIHNQGFANEAYLRKANQHVRAQKDMKLPVDVQYFLETYEYCLQLTEWIERELHEKWHSSEYEDRKNKKYHN